VHELVYPSTPAAADRFRVVGAEWKDCGRITGTTRRYEKAA